MKKIVFALTLAATLFACTTNEYVTLEVTPPDSPSDEQTNEPAPAPNPTTPTVVYVPYPVPVPATPETPAPQDADGGSLEPDAVGVDTTPIVDVVPAMDTIPTTQPGCTVGTPRVIADGNRAAIAGNDSGFGLVYETLGTARLTPGTSLRLFDAEGNQTHGPIGLLADSSGLDLGIGVSIGTSTDAFYPISTTSSLDYLHEVTSDGELIDSNNVREAGREFAVATGEQSIAFWQTSDENGCRRFSRAGISHGLGTGTQFLTDCALNGVRHPRSNSESSAFITVGTINGRRSASVVVVKSDGSFVTAWLYSLDIDESVIIHDLVAVDDGFIAIFSRPSLPDATDWPVYYPTSYPVFLSKFGNDGSFQGVKTFVEQGHPVDQRWVSNGRDLATVSRRYSEENPIGDVLFRRFSFEGELLQQEVVADLTNPNYEVPSLSVAVSGDNYAVAWGGPNANGDRRVVMSTIACTY
jgi:hypothetical protein